MSFQEFLNWLTSADGGAFILFSWAVAWGLEGFEFWAKWSSKARSLTVLGGAAVLAILGVWLGNQPELIEAIDPYFTAVSYVVLAWLATQSAHLFKNLRKPSEG